MENTQRLLLYTAMFCSAVCPLKSGAETIIKGKFWNLTGQVSAYYLAPIEGIGNVYYPKNIQIAKDNSFTVTLKLREPGFIKLEIPNSQINLFSNTNDTINLNCYYNKNINSKSRPDSITISGTNSNGNIIFNRYGNITLQQSFLSNHLLAVRKYNSVRELHTYFQFLSDSLISPLDSAYQNKQIGKDCYDYISTYIRVNLAVNMIIFFQVIIDNLSDSLHRGVNPTLYTKGNFDSLRLFLFQSLTVPDSIILSNPMGVLFKRSYSDALFKGIIKPDSSYDSSFLQFKQDDKYLGFLRGKSLQANWHNSLYWAIKDDPISKDLNLSFKMFKQYFPNSFYISYLEKALKEAKANSISEEAVYQKVKPIFLNGDENTINSLIAKKFKGKHVFVDLWATWCMPCVQEFAYKDRVYDFLQSKQIELLYISFDSKVEQEKWKSFVSKKELNGYHVLASEPLQEDIKKQFYNKSIIEIPRYVLINREGKIINKDLPRPSDMENLKKAINKYIQ